MIHSVAKMLRIGQNSVFRALTALRKERCVAGRAARRSSESKLLIARYLMSGCARASST